MEGLNRGSKLLIHLYPDPAPVLRRVQAVTTRQLPLLLYLAAALTGIHGNSFDEMALGAPWLAFAVCMWLVAELAANWEELRGSWSRLDRADKRLWLAGLLPAALWIRCLLLIVESMTVESSLPLLLAALGWFVVGAAVLLLLKMLQRSLAHRSANSAQSGDLVIQRSRSWHLSLKSKGLKSLLFWRLVWFILAVSASASVWANTSGNQIQPNTMRLWFGSALCWALLFAPLGWNFFDWVCHKIDALRRFSWHKHWTVALAFLGIMALGASFRLTQLDSLPPEMFNSDHRAPILTAYAISQGQYPIMLLDFQAQGTMHYYLMALFVQLTGLGFNHNTLKLVAVLESLITLPVLFWMGLEFMGRQNRKYGLAMGLMVSGLVAVSFWHVVITRYAMRTHLTTLFAALTFIYLARAMRENRRSDYIKMGLTLGFGMYGYAACRVLPLAVIAGIGLALVVRRITWRERLLFLVNSAVAALVAFVVYLPLLHFSMEFPYFASYQVSQNVFGVPYGQPIEINLDAFLTGLMVNFRDALLMFNWLGDHREYQALPFKPSLDVYTGALLILGLAAWVVRLFKSRRDPVYWFVPVMILVMMLPSVLNVAAPETNPSNTRISGAIPAIHLLAALPIMAITSQIGRSYPRKLGKVLAVAFCALILLLANQRNTSLYFDDFADLLFPSLSFRHMGTTVRGLAESDVPWGNIFLIYGPNFYFDRHYIFIEAGKTGLASASGIESMLNLLDSARSRRDEYRLDPDRDLVFIHSSTDDGIARQLRQWFPQGRDFEVHAPEKMTQSYMLYRVPILGDAGLSEVIAKHT